MDSLFVRTFLDDKSNPSTAAILLEIDQFDTGVRLSNGHETIEFHTNISKKALNSNYESEMYRLETIKAFFEAYSYALKLQKANLVDVDKERALHQVVDQLSIWLHTDRQDSFKVTE